jgi:hypothetical protein
LNAALQLKSSQLEAKNNHALRAIFDQKFYFLLSKRLFVVLLAVLIVYVSINFRYTSSRMRVNTMEDDSVFEEDGEGEERDSFVQPARGLRSFALVSWLFIRTWKLSLHHHHGISC